MTGTNKQRIGFLCCTGLIIAYLTLFFVTLDDYGVPFDEAQGEAYLGERYFQFLVSGSLLYLDLSRPVESLCKTQAENPLHAKSAYAIKNAHHIWGFGQTLMAGTKKIFHCKLNLLSAIDAAHASTGILCALMFVSIYAFSARWFTPSVGLFAVTALMLYPRFWAYSHYNPKDIAHAAFYCLTLLCFAHAALTTSRGFLLLSAVLWGLSLATKANAYFMPIVTLPFFLVYLFRRLRRNETNGLFSFSILLFVLPLLSFAVMIIAWPYLLADFPTNLYLHLEFLQSRGFEGSPHWKSYPLFNGIYTAPVALLVLLSVGLLRLLAAFFRPDHRGVTPEIAILLLLWLAVPLLRVSVPYAEDFDVIRHWLELLPALCIIAALGFNWLGQALRALFAGAEGATRLIPNLGSSLICAALFLPTLFWNYQNHPYQYVFYNRLTGGLGGAQAAGLRESNDYWAVSYRKGMDWLNSHAEPDSELYVGFAQHVVSFTKDIWLRDDITLNRIQDLNAEMIEGKQFRSPTYLLVAPRKGHMPQWLRSYSFPAEAVAYKAVVDDGTVFTIYKLTN